MDLARRMTSALATGLSMACAAAAQTPAAINEASASAVFGEARTLCSHDGGRIWGRSLCGPIMLVEPESRYVVANQADPHGLLAPTRSLFTGPLPDTVIMSNTPTSWSGVYWAQMIWPLPDDQAARHVLIAHELFHRIQRDLDIPHLGDGDNSHLDTLEGRYWLQLEWRALARALSARTRDERNNATSDALLFRTERYRRFPGAAPEEHALEMGEGVAEYTGVRVGLRTQASRIQYALRDLSVHVQDQSFVRSFAYATGPAYGLLLDRADPSWRGKLKSGRRLDQLLQAALRLSTPGALETAAQTRAAAYDDGSLRASEEAREAERQERMLAFRARFINGPVLNLPLENATREFRPPTLVPFDDLGMVYPTLRLTDDWGALEVTGGAGALLHRDMRRATVSLVGVDSTGLRGEGWLLTLNPGWTIRTDARAGDLAVTRAQ